MDKLAEKGWSTMSLSIKVFIINGEEQPKKVHKKYLKLYKEITGRPLAADKTIEFRE